MWLHWLSVVSYIEKSLVRFLIGTHAWVVDSVPNGMSVGGSWLVFLSLSSMFLSLPLPFSFSKKKSMKTYFEKLKYSSWRESVKKIISWNLRYLFSHNKVVVMENIKSNTATWTHRHNFIVCYSTSTAIDSVTYLCAFFVIVHTTISCKDIN